MIRIISFVFFFLACQLTVFAQRETDNWYFGQNASLEFNAAGLPVSFLNSAMDTPFGSATISDKAGNLLFYTDGETVWNRLHQVMQNGTGLTGNKQAAQPAIIIPKPGSTSHYYIFTKLKSGITNPLWVNLSYSEVDITANNGTGEVVAATKNTPLLGLGSGIFDKLTAVHHGNHQDIWVITIRDTPTSQLDFVALKITASGIDPIPVSNNLPLTTPVFSGGTLKASPSGKHLSATYGNSGAWLLDFNDKTGQISNPRQLMPPGQPVFDTEFSPDGSKLYFAGGTDCSQFNIALGTTAAIIASKTVIAPITSGVYAMQLASNGKIYLSKTQTGRLMEIANPNAAGLACNFRNSIMLAAPSVPRFGFPNFIQSYFAPARFNFAGICAEAPTTFTIPNQTNIDSVRWNFGDNTPGAVNTSTQMQPSHTYSLPGIFTVRLSVFQQGFQSVFERDVTILNRPKVQLLKDTSVCDGTVIFLTNLYPPNPFNEKLTWSTGVRDSAMIKVTGPGIYWLELSNGVCTTRDSIVIQYRPTPKLDLGPDRIICGNSPVVLDAGNPGATYRWAPGGETSQTLTITKPGTYSVTVTSNRCSVTDNINIGFNTALAFDLGEDITICEGKTVTLKTIQFTPAIKYLWSDGSQWPELEVTKSGKYWARVQQGNCIFTDTITVNFKECPPPIVPYIPNIISPNNDNRNDKFEIKKVPLNSWALKIYNRWGKEIYHNDRYSNNWPEQPVSDGTYYYILEEPETNRKFKGWVEVVR